MSAESGYGNGYGEDMDLDGSLDWKVGRMITVFTRSGGKSGRGFTGVLLEATCNYVKLITTLPCPPRSPFYSNFGCGCGGGRYGYSGGYGRGYSHRNPLGTIVVIPRSEIVSYVFNEI